MKAVGISDVRGNIAAPNARPEREFDAMWRLNNLVDYGPNPREVVDGAREQAKVAVRGKTIANNEQDMLMGLLETGSLPALSSVKSTG